MAAQPEPVTLLKVLIDRRQLTYAEVSERLAKRAASIGLPTFSLGERHLVRLLGGDVTRPRKPTCRVLEAEFGFPVDYLLAPFDGTMVGHVGVAPAGSGVSAPLRTLDFVAWLASAAGVEFAPTYELVAEVAQAHAALPAGVRAARAHARAQLPRTSIAAALMDYYGRDAPFYRVRVGDQATTTPLAVVTRPSWIGHGIELGGAHEAIDVVAAEETPAIKMTPAVFHAAVQRLLDATLTLILQPGAPRVPSGTDEP